MFSRVLMHLDPVQIVEALIQDQRDMVSAARLLATETGAEDVLACLESL